jgi:CheY-like chemotaxis protein
MILDRRSLSESTIHRIPSQDAEGAAMVGQISERVLLVDDDPLVRKLISGYLVAAGYVVRTAVDGLDALAKLRAGLPDLIISDLNMPRMSGPELLEVVRKRFPQIPVMVISSETADAMPVGVAADAYYHKSGFGFQQLLETVSDLARKPPLRTAPPHVDAKALQARRVGDGHYLVGCKDCLREFSVRHATAMGRHKMWTICVHCGGDVRFEVAEHPEGK